MTLREPTTNPSELLRRIQVLNKQRRFNICRAAVAFFCADVLRLLNRWGPALYVVFVHSREMRSLNQRYLGRDYATDVLSFAYDETLEEEAAFLGEIVIAPEMAALHATRYGIHPEKELRKLLVHGILHLLGYNHETDKGKMNRLQATLLRRRALAHSPSLMGRKEPV